MSPLWADLTPPYRTIVADPPWRYSRSGVAGSVDEQYSTLTQQEIADLPVRDLAATDAHLYLWVTVPKLWDEPTPAQICEGWGFTYKTLITWVKGNKAGLGWYYRTDTEHCVFATRGKAPIPGGLRQSNVLWAPRGAHSAKPDAFLDRVDIVSPSPRVELFSRRPHLGWDSWGKGYEIGGAA